MNNSYCKAFKIAKKIIAVDHNPRPFKGYPLKKRIQKRVKGLLYSRYIDLFVGVSQYTVNEIIKDFGSHLTRKSLVVYNGIAYEKFIKRANRNSIKPTFLVACHLRYSKGIQDLIDAVALLPENILEQLDALQMQQLNSVLNLPLDSLTVNTDIYITLTK